MKKINIYGKYPIYVDPLDRRSDMIIKKGGTQFEKINTIKKIFDVFSPKFYLDIGANYGEFSVPFLDRDIQMCLFEPHPDVFRCLKRTIYSYHTNNVELVNKAAWINNSVLDFHMPDSSGGSSLMHRHDKIHKKTIQVDSVDIFSYIPRESFVVKMDVEGAESYILQRIIESAKSEYFIMFEYNRKYVSQEDKYRFNSILKNKQVFYQKPGKRYAWKDMNFSLFSKLPKKNKEIVVTNYFG